MTYFSLHRFVWVWGHFWPTSAFWRDAVFTWLWFVSGCFPCPDPVCFPDEGMKWELWNVCVLLFGVCGSIISLAQVMNVFVSVAQALFNIWMMLLLEQQFVLVALSECKTCMMLPAFQWDFTMMGGMLFVFIIVLICLGFLCLIIQSRVGVLGEEENGLYCDPSSV